MPILESTWPTERTAAATTGIILGAGYMLYLYRRVAFGTQRNEDAAAMPDLNAREWAMLAPIAAAVLWMGVYPESFLAPMRQDIAALEARVARAAPDFDADNVVGTPRGDPRRIPKPMDSLYGTSQLMMRSILKLKLKLQPPDVFVQPPVSDFRVMDFLKAKQIIAIEDRAQAWLSENAPALQTPGTGLSLMFAHIGQNNINSMIKGSLIALLLISLTLVIALRSWKFGLLSMLPNAFPSMIAFGIWGLTVSNVNLAVAAVFSITLGIVVDNTIHFFSKYLVARRERGDSPSDAVRYAISTVGSALLVTTASLALGFFILAQSNFDVNASMGLMTAMVIGLAVLFDLLFLPGLLLRFDRAPRLMPDARAPEATQPPTASG